MRRTRLAYVAMAAEVLEQLDFAQCALGENLLAEYIGDFLNGDSFTALVIDGSAARGNSLATKLCGQLPRRGVMGVSRANSAKESCGGTRPNGQVIDSPNNSVGSLTKFLGHSVSLIDNEVLVEHLEDFASLEVGHGGEG